MAVLDSSYGQLDDIHRKAVSLHSTDGNRNIIDAATGEKVSLEVMGKRDYDADKNNPKWFISLV